ncbi:hypothetical protein DSM43518_04028 [Mycobacterium marinum]|nr:hypothetical protein DSM43518_04028 [Mycobacterium marinum]RFZ17963.1 hypothetical protein DSM44344_05258 [Mycobacterium marinum]RFZ33101.1 hypothetical protein NCTC2275_02880 [Mycobacterium marinum]
MCEDAALLSARSNSDLECVGGKVISGGPATASEPVVRAATMAANRCVAACTALAFRDVVTANSTTAIPVSSSTEQQATVAM